MKTDHSINSFWTVWQIQWARTAKGKHLLQKYQVLDVKEQAAKMATRVHFDAFQLDPVFITTPLQKQTESVLWGTGKQEK